jgi:hypothetical protein
MKKIMLLTAFFLTTLSITAQEVKFPPLDNSPVDISYFPSKAVKFKKGETNTPSIKIVYSRPSVKGRAIFGELIPFGKVWRVGANENTELKCYKAITIGGVTLAAGTYSLFAIPEKDKWVIIINKDTDLWGAYPYDESKDIVRVTVPVKTAAATIEALSIIFTPSDAGANLVIGWDKTIVEVPVIVK